MFIRLIHGGGTACVRMVYMSKLCFPVRCLHKYPRLDMLCRVVDRSVDYWLESPIVPDHRSRKGVRRGLCASPLHTAQPGSCSARDSCFQLGHTLALWPHGALTVSLFLSGRRPERELWILSHCFA